MNVLYILCNTGIIYKYLEFSPLKRNVHEYNVRQFKTCHQLSTCVHMMHVPETISGQSVVVKFVDITIANLIDLFIIVII